MNKNQKWLQWATELQNIAQAGLICGTDLYDAERYERIQEISTQMISRVSEISTEKIGRLFGNEIQSQTPKIVTRAAIFKGDKILLVRERGDRWSLPGGWCDVNTSIVEGTIKEVKEDINRCRGIICS